jgi:hypothetical protein
MKKWLTGIVGIAAVLLGGLWMLQGLGAVKMEPILCFADCAPVQEPSPKWAGIGAAVLAAGAFSIVYAVRLRKP